MVTKIKEGRGANGGAGRSVTESAAAQTAPAARKKAAEGTAAGEAKEGARGGKPAASQNKFDASPRGDDATADTVHDLPGSSAAIMSSKKLLTEAEVLKMGDRDYTNEAQLTSSKDRLARMHDEILANVNRTVSDLRKIVVVPDPADRATIEEEHALELCARDCEHKLFKKVERSIVRIDAGDYGYCDETGEPIGMPRLTVRPTANLTLEAQERREKHQKMHGG